MEDWQEIHRFVTSSWKLPEQPCAYLFSGDPIRRQTILEQAGCKVVTGSYVPTIRYRVPTELGKRPIVAAIRMRSLMDEAFSAAYRTAGTLGDTPLAKHYVDILRHIGGLGMKLSLAMHESRQDVRPDQNRERGTNMVAPKKDDLQTTVALDKMQVQKPTATAPSAGEGITVNSGDHEVVVAPNAEKKAPVPTSRGLEEDMTATLFIPRKRVCQGEKGSDPSPDAG
jgi:hypothetical protein